MSRSRHLSAMAVALLLATGCGGSDDATAPDEPVADSETALDGSPSPEVSPAALADVVDQARQLVADQEGVSVDDIELIQANTVTWPDGALGCPKPDQMYTQALVEGYRIVFEVDGREVFVHGAEGEDPFICEDPQEPASTGS